MSLGRPAGAVERDVPKGQCSELSDVAFKTATKKVATSSQAFVDLPNGSVHFGTDTADSCAIVRFSATCATLGTIGTIFVEVQVVLDDLQVAAPGPIQWRSAQAQDVLSFEFILPSVAVGRHTAKVQWRSVNGLRAEFASRTLTVTYR
jgi:hypothetical protein